MSTNGKGPTAKASLYEMLMEAHGVTAGVSSYYLRLAKEPERGSGQWAPIVRVWDALLAHSGKRSATVAAELGMTAKEACGWIITLRKLGVVYTERADAGSGRYFLAYRLYDDGTDRHGEYKLGRTDKTIFQRNAANGADKAKVPSWNSIERKIDQLDRAVRAVVQRSEELRGLVTKSHEAIRSIEDKNGDRLRQEIAKSVEDTLRRLGVK